MYGLYKVKTLSLICGDYYRNSQMAMMGGYEEVTPPYIFDRVEHRPKMPVVGNYSFEECHENFMMDIIGQV